MDLNLLPAFAAVAETSSFSRAAQKLRLPKSSVSRNVAASPEYLARRGTPGSPAELDGHACVVLRGREKLKLVSATETAAVTLKGRFVVDEMTFLRLAVRAGAGIGCLRTFLGQEDVRAGTMVRVLPRWTVDSGFLWFVTPPGALPRKVAVFRDFLQEEPGAI